MAKKGPLKKVVREFTRERKRYLAVPTYDMYEELECGHIIRKPKDLYGEYHAEKRRCTQCATQPTLAPDKGQAGGSIGQESLPLAGKA